MRGTPDLDLRGRWSLHVPSFATQALATGVLDGLLSQNSLRAGFWTCSRKLPPVCPTRLRYLTLLLVSGATDEPSQQVLSLALQHEERNSRSKKSQRLHFLRWVLLPLPVTLPGRKVCFADASCLPSGPAAKSDLKVFLPTSLLPLSQARQI